MLGENIKSLRKQKGLSQETLAGQLNVVRQTVSKWEQGLSVPDAEMLNRISELFEVPVSTLLGSTIEEQKKTDNSEIEAIANQLAILNEQLAMQAVRKRKLRKNIIRGILIAFVLFIMLWMTCFYFFRVKPRHEAVLTTKHVECTLNGEEYSYCAVYDQNFRIYEAGGDGFIANHIPVEQYDDVNVLFAQIEDYFVDHGGTFRIVEDSE